MPAAPIHTQWDIVQWKDGMVELYQAKSGSHEAGGFVKSAVRVPLHLGESDIAADGFTENPIVYLH